MQLDTWLTVYGAICEEFGYDPDADDLTADRLAALLSTGPIDRLDFTDDHVAIVVGAALDADARREATRADRIVATGDALEPLERAAIVPSLVVTDLDSDPPRVCARTRTGGLVAVHAHGDNAALVDRWVPRMNRRQVIGTTQGIPTDPLLNAGGFTDGDRAAFLAHAQGARRLSLVGWDLSDRSVSTTKRAKLAWASRLLSWLEAHRGEHYAALDGHRSSLEAAVPSLAE